MIEIKDCGRADLPALIELYAFLNPGDLPCSLSCAADSLGQLGRYPGSAILTGWLDGSLVGSCTLIVIPNISRAGTPYALIENVVTHGDYRKRGFGTAMLKEAVGRAWARGCYKVMLLTGTAKQSTLDFYAGAGFAQTKTGFQIRR